MRWMNHCDGTKESLMDISHRSHFRYPNVHKDTIIKWINNCLSCNPNISMIEFYTKLRINHAIKSFNYQSQIIQSDNGYEFT